MGIGRGERKCNCRLGKYIHEALSGYAECVCDEETPA